MKIGRVLFSSQVSLKGSSRIYRTYVPKKRSRDGLDCDDDSNNNILGKKKKKKSSSFVFLIAKDCLPACLPIWYWFTSIELAMNLYIYAATATLIPLGSRLERKGERERQKMRVQNGEEQLKGLDE